MCKLSRQTFHLIYTNIPSVSWTSLLHILSAKKMFVIITLLNRGQIILLYILTLEIDFFVSFVFLFLTRTMTFKNRLDLKIINSRAASDTRFQTL